MKKAAVLTDSRLDRIRPERLALACLEARILFIDHVSPALAANNATITVPLLQRLDRIRDFHDTSPNNSVGKASCLREARNIWWRMGVVNA